MIASDSDTIRLGEIAHARSGDKGNHANVGVIAFTTAGYEYLREVLTEEAVGDYFQALGATGVECFELPGIGGLNFLLHNVLAGGASRSLRVDSQGKTLGLAILELHIPRPAELARMLRGNSE